MGRMKFDGALVLFSQLVWFLPWVLSQTPLEASTRPSAVTTGRSLWVDEALPNDTSASYQTTTSDEISDPRMRLAGKTINGLPEHKIMDEQRVANKRKKRGFIQSNIGNAPEMKKMERHSKKPSDLKAHHARNLHDKRYKLFNHEEADGDKEISLVEPMDQKQNTNPNVKSEIQNILASFLNKVDLSLPTNNMNHFSLNKTFDFPQEKTNSKSPLYHGNSLEYLGNIFKMENYSDKSPSTSKENGHSFASSAFSIMNASKQSSNMSRRASEDSILQEYGHSKGIFGRMSEIHSPPYKSPARQLPPKKTSSALGLLPEGVTNIRQSSASLRNPSLSPSIPSALFPKMSDRRIEPISPLEFIDHSLSPPTSENKILELLLKEWSNLDAHLSTSSSNIASEVQSNPHQNAVKSASQSELSSPTSDLLFLDSNDILPMSPTLSGLLKTGGIRHENPTPQGVNSFISPELLGNMLLRIQVPSVGELTHADPVTRITPELVDAVTDFIDNISDAITQLLTDLQQIFNDNPLLTSLLAIGLFALLWHFFPKRKKKKGHWHGHHEQGYHRSWQPQFRKLDDYGQRLTLKVMSDLEGFGKWLNTTENMNEGL